MTKDITISAVQAKDLLLGAIEFGRKKFAKTMVNQCFEEIDKQAELIKWANEIFVNEDKPNSEHIKEWREEFNKFMSGG